MNIFRLAFELFLIYLAYKVIFEFIIPVYKTTKQMKRKMADMQQKMQQQHQHNEAQKSSKPSFNSEAIGGEYIDYEEIK